VTQLPANRQQPVGPRREHLAHRSEPERDSGGLCEVQCTTVRPEVQPGPRPARSAERGGGLNPEEARVRTEAIDVLKQHGAIIVAPVVILSISTNDPDKSFLKWGQCSGAASVKGRDANCSVGLNNGMKRDFQQDSNRNRVPSAWRSPGMACSEPKLLEFGYAFEQATKRRVPPPSMP